MDMFGKENKTPDKKKKKGGGMGNLPGGRQLWANLVGTVLILLVLVSIYSFIAENQKKDETISLSKLASDINAGQVLSVAVHGDDLSIVYVGDVEKKSKKETDAALSESLKNYGVTSERAASFSFFDFFSTSPTYTM